LTTLNFYYDGKLHYDKPQSVNQPQLLSLRFRSDTTRRVPAAVCADQRISRDTLSLKCESKYLGVVTVEGRFLDRRGDFGNLLSNASHPQFVLSAVVTVSRGGRVLYRRRHRFTYFNGD
jgi:hypothetical protein